MNAIKKDLVKEAIREVITNRGKTPSIEEVERRFRRWVRLCKRYPEDWAFAQACR